MTALEVFTRKFMELAATVPPSHFLQDRERRLRMLRDLLSPLGEEADAIVAEMDTNFVKMILLGHEKGATGFQVIAALNEAQQEAKSILEALGVSWLACLLVFAPCLPALNGSVAKDQASVMPSGDTDFDAKRYLAAMNQGDIESVSAMVLAGCDFRGVSYYKDGRLLFLVVPPFESMGTLLAWAIVKQAPLLVEQLLLRGCDPNWWPDRTLSQPPLHTAVGTRQRELVQLLVSSGANVNAQDPAGTTALDLAEACGFGEIGDLLRASGAKTYREIVSPREPSVIAPPDVRRSGNAALSDKGASLSIDDLVNAPTATPPSKLSAPVVATTPVLVPSDHSGVRVPTERCYGRIGPSEFEHWQMQSGRDADEMVSESGSGIVNGLPNEFPYSMRRCHEGHLVALLEAAKYHAQSGIEFRDQDDLEHAVVFFKIVVGEELYLSAMRSGMSRVIEAAKRHLQDLRDRVDVGSIEPLEWFERRFGMRARPKAAGTSTSFADESASANVGKRLSEHNDSSEYRTSSEEASVRPKVEVDRGQTRTAPTHNARTKWLLVGGVVGLAIIAAVAGAVGSASSNRRTKITPEQSKHGLHLPGANVGGNGPQGTAAHVSPSQAGGAPASSTNSMGKSAMDCTSSDHHYIVCGGRTTWSEASARCNQLGGELASITRDLEQREIDHALDTAARTGLMPGASGWIGGTDVGTEGRFRWVDGMPFAYSNWQPADPNNGGRSGFSEDCMATCTREAVRTNTCGAAGWVDMRCDTTTEAFICKRKIDAPLNPPVDAARVLDVQRPAQVAEISPAIREDFKPAKDAYQASNTELSATEAIRPSSQPLQDLTHQIKASASSSLPKWRHFQFDAANLIDGTFESSWQPNAKRSKGVGQWFKLVFPRGVEVHEIQIANGFQSTYEGQDLFNANVRLRAIEIEVGGQTRSATLDPEERGFVRIAINPPLVGDKLKVTATAVQDGSRWPDLAVSEIRVFGQEHTLQHERRLAQGSPRPESCPVNACPPHYVTLLPLLDAFCSERFGSTELDLTSRLADEGQLSAEDLAILFNAYGAMYGYEFTLYYRWNTFYYGTNADPSVPWLPEACRKAFPSRQTGAEMPRKLREMRDTIKSLWRAHGGK